MVGGNWGGKGFGGGGESGRGVQKCAPFLCQIVNGIFVQGAE